jgi:hypothetical protein
VQVVNDRRMALDHALLSLPEGEPERDVLWHDLDAIQEALLLSIRRLAAVAASGVAELQGKATVLAALLHMPAADASAPAQELCALALSVAEDAIRLL